MVQLVKKRPQTSLQLQRERAVRRWVEECSAFEVPPNDAVKLHSSGKLNGMRRSRETGNIINLQITEVRLQ